MNIILKKYRFTDKNFAIFFCFPFLIFSIFLLFVKLPALLTYGLCIKFCALWTNYVLKDNGLRITRHSRTKFIEST